MKDYNKAIGMNAKHYKALYNRGLTKTTLNNNKGAIEDFSKAIELNSHYGDAYYNRGIAKLNLGQKEAACQDFRKAEQLSQINVKAALKKNCE